MFNKKFEYGELVNLEDKGFVFMTGDEEENLDKTKLISAMNYLGEKGWEFVQSDKHIGLIFKR